MSALPTPVRRSGYWRGAVFGGIAAIVLSLIVIGTEWHMERHENDNRSEMLALYWNRYAANYYEAFGRWEGIETRLNADAADYPDDGIAVVVLDEHGRTVASYDDSTGNGSTLRKPVVEGGRITGYTQTEMPDTAKPGLPIVIASIMIAVIGFGLWLLMNAQRERMWKNTLDQLYSRTARLLPAASAGAHSSDSHEDAVEVEERLEYALSQAEIYIRKLETVRRSMVADIAHELRTPLAVMRSQLDNALHAGEPLPMEKTAAMYDELLHLAKLVHDLQELALAEAGKLPLAKHWFSLQSLAAAVVEALQAEAEECGVLLSLDAPHEVSVYADRTRIRQLIVNLAGNALRHARRQVTITVRHSDNDVLLSVQDDGLGMEEEQLEHIFERFYRGDAQSKMEGGDGLGLGLAIVKQYAEAHGGTVNVTSRWGEGTAFHAKLPVIVA